MIYLTKLNYPFPTHLLTEHNDLSYFLKYCELREFTYIIRHVNILCDKIK